MHHHEVFFQTILVSVLTMCGGLETSLLRLLVQGSGAEPEVAAVPSAVAIASSSVALLSGDDSLSIFSAVHLSNCGVIDSMIVLPEQVVVYANRTLLVLLMKCIWEVIGMDAAVEGVFVG